MLGRATAVVVLVSVVIGCEPATAESWRHHECRYASFRGGPAYNDTDVRRLIDCMTDHFPVPGGDRLALYIANRESGFECHSPTDRARYDATGVYQIVHDTWRHWWELIHERFAGWGIRNRITSCRPNVAVAIVAAHRWGWGPWGM